jgi:hypothetical protein
MGRYYTGDIEGKVWFAIQSSYDAGFFGGIECEPSYVSYEFTEYDLPTIKDGLKKCKEELGDWLPKIDKFFKEVNAYNNQVIEQHGYNAKEFNEKLEWYARYELGQKIYKYVKKYGDCNFEVEL